MPASACSTVRVSFGAGPKPQDARISRRPACSCKRTQLERYERETTANLPLGILRRLEIARALGTRPELILLDESFSGLSHREALDLVDLVRQLRADGMTVLMIEHNMKITMDLCDRVAVLDRGEKIAEGLPPAEIRSNQRVIAAYLGSDA